MAAKRWMLYGANGYTGRLLAELAVARGEHPVLAGRSAAPLQSLASRLGLEARAVGLGDPLALASALGDIDAVLHAAGPFSATSAPMVAACLAAGAHYLDITGEIGVLEAVLAADGAARKAGVVLVPGVGFDVVPTDCLAAMLAARLPGATHLALAIHGSGGLSPGTTKTMIEGFRYPLGGAVRRAGRIVPVAASHEVREVPFPRKVRTAVAIPWGDIATAWHSTGIPDIVTYMALAPGARRSLRVLDALRPLAGSRLGQRVLRGLVERFVQGPDPAARARGYSEVWGEVRDAEGKVVTGALTAPEGYSFTADSALRALQRVRAGAVAAGAHTPSRAFGADFVTTCDGVVLHDA